MAFKTFCCTLTTPKLEAGTFLRIGLLADLHNTPAPGLYSAVRRSAPDFLLLAGDMITAPHDGGVPLFGRAYGLIARLAEQMPVFAVPGNHEERWKAGPYRELYDAYRQGLMRKGVVFPENESFLLSLPGGDIRLTGLALPLSGYRSPRFLRRKRLGGSAVTAEGLRSLLGRPDPSVFTLLAAHDPRHFEAYADWGADLTLSGHLHGGTVRLPGLGGLIGPGFEFFPRYDRGLYRRGDSRLFVTAGAGMHTLPVRILNRREYVLIHLAGTGEKGDL